MQTIQENNEKFTRLAAKAWDSFYNQCSEGYNLSDKSIASLMGVSRQTVVNWCSGKSAPCVGTIMRIKMVSNTLEKAHSDEKLPATSRNKQDMLVQEILK